MTAVPAETPARAEREPCLRTPCCRPEEGAAGFCATGLSTTGTNGAAGPNGQPASAGPKGTGGFSHSAGPDGESGQDDIDENGAHVEDETLNIIINGQSTIQTFNPFSEDVDVEDGQNGNFTSFNGSTTISLTSDPTLGRQRHCKRQ